MKPNRGIWVLTAACLLALTGMFMLPLLGVPTHSVTKNTLSEFGAQLTPHAWIMNFIFISLAWGSLMAGWRYYEGFMLHRILLVMFGTSLALMAFFNQAPLRPDIPYNITEDGWHAYFSCTTGLSFVLLSIATSLILERPRGRFMAIASGIAVIFLSLLMAEADRLAGIWQRLIFIIAFGWMIYNFKTGHL